MSSLHQEKICYIEGNGVSESERTPALTVNSRKKKPVYAGLSITHHKIELGVFSPKTMAFEQCFSMPVPSGLFDHERDMIRETEVLKTLIGQVLLQAKPRPSHIHLSLPGTLLRMVEMPKIDTVALYLSLSSEAERYKMFDETEATVDFVIVDNPALPGNMLQLVLGAVRNDALLQYLRIFKSHKVKVESISLEPVNVLRGMAGSGVLDGLMQQISQNAHWGMIFVEPARVRFSVWQSGQLIELRELAMDTRDFVQPRENMLVVEDMLEEIRRTTKNVQPVIWLTQGMPPAMENTLSELLGCPVRPAPIGNAVSFSQPLELSTIGCTMSSVVPFPFELDIQAGMSVASGSQKMDGAAFEPSSIKDAGGAPSSNKLIPLGIGALVLGSLLTGILLLMATMTAQQVPPLQSQLDTVKTEVATLEARQRELKTKVELDQSLIRLIQLSKVRNKVYVALAEDLKRKTPEKIWIQSLNVTDNLEIKGKALNHRSVINFAKSFDAAPYTKAILIDSISEAKMGSAIVYDFKVSGGVNLSNAAFNSDTAPLPSTAASETGE